MAIGHPDWGQSAPRLMVSSSLDSGEIAARLGSPVLFNRSGNVLFFDDFEASTLHWAVSTSGAGSAGALDTTTAYMGERSVRLTAAGVASGRVDITHIVVLPVLQRIGLEGTFELDTTSDRLEMAMRVPAGGVEYTPTVRLTVATGQVSVSTPSGYVVVGTLEPFYEVAWHSLKMVVDPTTGLYVTIYADSQKFDASAQEMNEALFNLNYMNVGFFHYSNGVSVAVGYLDNAIVTINEP